MAKGPHFNLRVDDRCGAVGDFLVLAVLGLLVHRSLDLAGPVLIPLQLPAVNG